jgi:hypothetical protein
VTGLPRAEDRRRQVVITRFDCGSLVKMLILLALHHRVKKDVRRAAEGFLGATVLIEWRRRTIQSISLWEGLGEIYSMGGVDRHIRVSRVPTKLGIETECDVYARIGEWKKVMFEEPTVRANRAKVPSGLNDLTNDPMNDLTDERGG